MKRILLVILCSVGWIGAQTLNNQNLGPFFPGGVVSPTQFLGPFFQQPFFLSSPNSLSVQWTPGLIYVGNGPVNIAGNSITVAANKTTCAASAIVSGTDSCNYIYSNAAGTIATTTAIGTAIAAGNSLLALAVSNASGVTSLQAPYQSTLGTAGLTTSGYFLITSSITPTATSAAIQTVGQAFTFTGAVSGDNIVLVNYPAPTSLCPATEARATGANSVTIYFTVLTAAACTPVAGSYVILVIR